MNFFPRRFRVLLVDEKNLISVIDTLDICVICDKGSKIIDYLKRTISKAFVIPYGHFWLQIIMDTGKVCWIDVDSLSISYLSIKSDEKCLIQIRDTNEIIKNSSSKIISIKPLINIYEDCPEIELTEDGYIKKVKYST